MYPIITNVCNKFRHYLQEELRKGNKTINAKEVSKSQLGLYVERKNKIGKTKK